MKQRGKRIRPSGKDLVFHFTIASLLPVFPLVVGLFHVKTIQQINWQDFNLSQADKIDIPYLIISFSVAILICLLVAFGIQTGSLWYELNNFTTVKTGKDDTWKQVVWIWTGQNRGFL